MTADTYTYEIMDRADGRCAAVTGMTIDAAYATIPDTLGEYPVRVLKTRAFAGKQMLKEIILPDSADTLESFLFHNCKALRKITLTDSVTEYGEGVIRQCTALREIVVRVLHGDFTLVSRMLADSDNTLTFDLTMEDGRAVVTFPGFVYDFTENTMARTIQFNIAGSGMAFRECAGKKGIDYAEYDRLFARAMLDEISVITEVAFGRLMYPYMLSERARKSYEDYLRSHASHILQELITARDTEKLAFFTARHLVPAEALPDALAYATRTHDAQVTALLMACAGETDGAGQGLSL